MSTVERFVFNPFAENTYVVSGKNGQCIIIDPGCYTPREKQQLLAYIEKEGLQPVRLINTHCHIDHVAGNRFVSEQFGIKPEMHPDDKVILDEIPEISRLYNIPVDTPPAPGGWLEEGDVITFDGVELTVVKTPGHSPGSISLVNFQEEYVIVGDVLFQGSIGRTDFTGGDYNTLIRSIKEKLFPLGDRFRVFPGHGPFTTIGYEKLHNPFLR